MNQVYLTTIIKLGFD